MDGEEFETRKKELTPNQIINEFGKKDPATHYLVKIRGYRTRSASGTKATRKSSFTTATFQIVSTGPTPVSACDGRGGIHRRPAHARL